MMKRMYLLLVGALALTGLALADELILHNGAVVTGTYIGGDARSVRFIGPDGNVQTYALGHVSSIRFSPPPTAAAPPIPAARPVPAVPAVPPVPVARPAPVRPPVPVARPASAAPPVPAARRGSAVPSTRRAARSRPRIMVPAGTLITVRLIDPIDADLTGVGERFRASIDDPVTIGGRTVIPRYADATVQVMRVEQSGALKGSDEVALKLYDVTLKGHSYPIATNYAEHQGKGKGRKTVRNTALGGIGGAVLGGILGGAKGAAKGAAIGAGGGVAVSALRGTKLRIPSETRLKFVLRAPLGL